MAPRGYRKLPGGRRGILLGASVWAGEDHVLAVESWRTVEEYRRFYYRDIQGVVLTKAASFHIPWRGTLALLALLILVPFVPAMTAQRAPVWLSFAVWMGLFSLAALYWVAASLLLSCTCDILTAVNRYRVRAIYRMRTGKRFLEELSRRVEAVQGFLDTTVTDAVAPPPLPPPPVEAETPISHGSARTPFTIALVVLLLADALIAAGAGTAGKLAHKIGNGVAVLQVVAFVGIIFEYTKGRASKAARNFAVITLMFLGAALYAQQVVLPLVHMVAESGKKPPAPLEVYSFPEYLVYRYIYTGVCVVLALTGTVLMLRDEAS